jgi:hypothetical protein
MRRDRGDLSASARRCRAHQFESEIDLTRAMAAQDWSSRGSLDRMGQSKTQRNQPAYCRIARADDDRPFRCRTAAKPQSGAGGLSPKCQ